MRRFNFEIEPSATITCRPRERGTRDLLRSMFEKNQRRAVALEAAKYTASPVGSVSSVSRGHVPTDRHRMSEPSARASIVVRGNHFDYRDFRISTARPIPGSWVAYFARSDGRCVLWNSVAVPVVETAHHPAEALAVADATLSIDEIISLES
jgi:hypothetical protein